MTEPVRAELEFDIEDASEKANEFLDSFGASALGLNATFELAGKALDVVTEAMGFAIELGQKLIELGEGQAAAENRILTSARLRGQVTEGLLDQLGELNDALLQQAGIGDDITQSIQAQLLAVGVYRADLPKATLAVIGFSEAHGIPTQKAIKTIGQVIEGNLDVLKRYNVQAKDVNEVIDRYAEFSTLATERSSRLAGQIDILNENVGELGEEFGRIINTNAEAQRSIRGLSDDLVALNKIVKENPGAVEGFFSGAWDGVKSALESVSPLVVLAKEAAGLFDDGAAPAVDTSNIPDAIRQQELLIQARNDRLSTENQKRIEEEAKRRAKALEEQLKGEAEVEAELTKRFIDREKTKLQLVQVGIDAELELNNLRREQLIEGEVRLDEALTDIRVEAFQAERDLKEAMLDQELADQQRAFDKKIASLTKFSKRYLDTTKLVEKGFSDLQLQLVDVAAGAFGVLEDGLARSIGILVESAVTGEDAIGKIRAMFGGLLSGFADSLIGIGTGAIALQLLSAVPFLAKLAGPPGASAAAGVAALAAGATIKAIAAALGGGGSSSGGGSFTGSTGRLPNTAVNSGASDANQQRASEEAYIDRLLNRGREEPSTSSARGSSSRSPGRTNGGGGDIVNEFHMHPRGAVVVGGHDRAARDLHRLQRRGARLRGESFRLAG